MRRCRVESERLAVAPDPVAITRRLHALDGLMALIGVGDHDDARWSLIAALPREELVVPAGAAAPQPFGALERLVLSLQVDGAPEGPAACGVLAMLGYDLRTRLERLPDRHPRDHGCPDLLARAFDAAIVVDRASGAVRLDRLVDREDAAFSRGAAERARRLREALMTPPPSGLRSVIPAPPPSALPRGEYEAAVRRILELIRAGDVYQVNFAQRFAGTFDGDVFGLLERVARRNPAPFGGLVRLGRESWLLSASPERFLAIDGRRAVARPIKGTIARGATDTEDAERRATLVSSTKDRAELAMIVDLLRNDLSRSCVPGSVVVTDPLTLETHPTIHHLVATVSGTIVPERSAVEVVRDAWPGGSISGVPKIRAMEVIDDLESARRGPYTGSLGWFGHDGRADLNILIRSIRLEGRRAWLHAGGGVTIRSDPEAEWRESCVKVQGLLEALSWEVPDGD
jgi:para-aminobenzoate synthetase component I